ncbi:hypothetical protein GCM10025868_43440 [Angustibacter aerolatus]|uniref:Uncharacterized protein n=1 Tax=Angustibacter aerolatus TaxID=1162965 RepID=A0ABQ6JP38_9ACTN|nr:hypothetical protein GCM10025868_43440 [Angustibacter aerolatus]
MPFRLVWVTRSPAETYGVALLAEVRRLAPDAVVVDTAVEGKPDVGALVVRVAHALGAEAVTTVTNRSLSLRLDRHVRRAGLVVLSPTWDRRADPAGGLPQPVGAGCRTLPLASVRTGRHPAGRRDGGDRRAHRLRRLRGAGPGVRRLRRDGAAGCAPEGVELDRAEQAAIGALAGSGLVPPLRLRRATG